MGKRQRIYRSSQPIPMTYSVQGPPSHSLFWFRCHFLPSSTASQPVKNMFQATPCLQIHTSTSEQGAYVLIACSAKVRQEGMVATGVCMSCIAEVVGGVYSRDNACRCHSPLTSQSQEFPDGVDICLAFSGQAAFLMDDTGCCCCSIRPFLRCLAKRICQRSIGRPG